MLSASISADSTDGEVEEYVSILLSHTLSGPRYPAASAARPPVVALQRVLHLVRIQRRRCRRQLPSRGVQLLRDHHRRAKDSDDGTCVGSERVQRSLPKHPAHHCGGEGAQGAEEAVRRHRRGPHRPPSEQDVHQGREHEGDDACDRAARTMMCVANASGGRTAAAEAAEAERRRRRRRRTDVERAAQCHQELEIGQRQRLLSGHLAPSVGRLEQEQVMSGSGGAVRSETNASAVRAAVLPHAWLWPPPACCAPLAASAAPPPSSSAPSPAAVSCVKSASSTICDAGNILMGSEKRTATYGEGSGTALGPGASLARGARGRRRPTCKP